MNVLPDIWAAFIFGAALGVTRPGSRLGGWRSTVFGAAVGGLAGGFLSGRWDEAAFCAAALAVLGEDWWKRKGKRVAKALGERGRAVIAGLLEKVRDAGAPVPEGVRA